MMGDDLIKGPWHTRDPPYYGAQGPFSSIWRDFGQEGVSDMGNEFSLSAPHDYALSRHYRGIALYNI